MSTPERGQQFESEASSIAPPSLHLEGVELVSSPSSASSGKSRWLTSFAWSTSLFAHVGLLVAPLDFVPERVPEKSQRSNVAIQIVEPSPPPPEQEPAPAPEVEEDVAPPVVPQKPTPRPQELLKNEPQPSDPEPNPPQELTGTTLVADGVSDFSVERGSGRERDGAIVPGRSVPSVQKAVLPAAPPAAAPAPKKPEPPPLVPLKLLSRRPSPPGSLGAALRRNYPQSARAAGVSGTAQVRARIETTGVVRVTQLVSESSTGFGAACQKTLVGSHWTPPLDKTGRAVITWISYKCSFVVDD